MISLQPDIPRVDAARAERAVIALDRALGGSKVLSAREARARCEAYARDESETAPQVPDGVVLATDSDDVVTCLRICEQHEVPVTPRGGGSGRTGGAVPVAGGVVLALEGMRGIKEIAREDLLVVVEPGVVLGDMMKAVEAEGLFYPVDPSSLGYCAVGGNVAENAGGPSAFKYGVTREYVLGCEAVLMGGTRLRAGRRTVKGVTGYDVVATMVGSEGTLAVFTELTLRLLPKPTAVRTLVALFSAVAHAGKCVSEIVARGLQPRCLELVDDGALVALRANGAAIDERASALLLIEIDGVGDLDPLLEQIGDACVSAGAIDVVVAQDEAQRARLWSARRELSPAVRRLCKSKLSEDVVVPRSKVAELLAACDRIRDEEQVRMLAYGHAGDGNLHVNFLWDHDDDLPRVDRAIERMFHATLALGGTLSGEHGIGVLKAPYLPLEQSPELIALQRRIKDAFDPKGLLNPGKIFLPGGAPHRAC
ncbi:MAG: FAD-binding protein [Deltaproteobacteria bacterium]|nr:FAD-binding protein [Deltaproteobacteria bacterium]